jgi:peroxiredoxin (alkyl hydroperoxide reductase subunit C)
VGEEIGSPISAEDMELMAQKLGIFHPGKGTNPVRAVKGMRASYANDVAIAAGWSYKEPTGAGVMVPPVANTSTAREQNGEHHDLWPTRKS